MSFLSNMFGMSQPEVAPIKPLPAAPDLTNEKMKRGALGTGHTGNIFTTLLSSENSNTKTTLLGD